MYYLIFFYLAKCSKNVRFSIYHCFLPASKTPRWLAHALSFTIGTILLLHFFYTNVLFQASLVLSAWMMLQISHKIGYGCRGLISAVWCVSFNMICELFLANPEQWHQIRGVQMILSMKLISIAFDMDTDVLQDSQKASKNKSEEKEDSIVQNLSKKDLRKRKFLQSKQESANLSENQMQTDEALIIKVPSLFEYFGYALCPGTTVFGPWVPYKEYLAIFVNPRWVSHGASLSPNRFLLPILNTKQLKVCFSFSKENGVLF